MYFPLRGGRQKLKGFAVVTMTGLGCAKGKAIVHHDHWPVKAFGQRPRRNPGLCLAVWLQKKQHYYMLFARFTGLPASVYVRSALRITTLTLVPGNSLS